MGLALDILRLDVIALMGEYGICVFAPQTQAELESDVTETPAMLEYKPARSLFPKQLL